MANNKLELTTDFTQNLFKLCNDLRSSGFANYAEELEQRFLFLKKAEKNLYEVIKETGEDVIDKAHPNGSNKLIDAGKDLGTVETILDKNKKIMQVFDKKPTAKLANKNIINAVKIILAQDYSGQIKDIIGKGLSQFKKSIDIVKNKNEEMANKEGKGKMFIDPLYYHEAYTSLEEAQEIYSSGKLYHDDIMKIKRKMEDWSQWINSALFITSDPEVDPILKESKNSLMDAESKYNAAFWLLKGDVKAAEYQLSLFPSDIKLINQTKPSSQSAGLNDADSSKLLNDYNDLLKSILSTVTLSQNKEKASPQAKEAWQKWLLTLGGYVKNRRDAFAQAYKSLTPEDRQSLLKQYSYLLEQEKAKLNELRNDDEWKNG